MGCTWHWESIDSYAYFGKFSYEYDFSALDVMGAKVREADKQTGIG